MSPASHDRRPGAALPLRRGSRGRRSGFARLGVAFPVAIDGDRSLWHAYGCEGWPSLFLWNGGRARLVHFGEGEYLATEEAIQAELREHDALQELPEPIADPARHGRPRRG